MNFLNKSTFYYLRYAYLSIVLLLLSNLTKAQDASKTINYTVQQQLENLSESNLNEDNDYTNLLEQLHYFQEHPINLNHTSRDELQELQTLNDIQINNLLAHIHNNGKLITIYELQTIDGFSSQTIQALLPYVRVSEHLQRSHFSIKEMLTKGNNNLLLRYGQTLEEQKGFTSIDSASLAKSPNSRYIGSPHKLYIKYRFRYNNNVSWGITADKDQGELLFKKNQNFTYKEYEQALKGNQKTNFDFYSAHLFLKNTKHIKALAIGDYRATFGQGLILWNGFSFGKSTDILSIKKVASGIQAYTSTDENNFMRGIASTIRIKKIDLTGFISHHKIDANIADTLNDGGTSSVSSLQASGYHSTVNEIADKDAITQTIIGGNITYNGNKLTLGITAIDFQMNKNLTREFDYYNQFEFIGKHNVNIGLNYNYVVKNFNFFGEQAISKSGGLAFINGALISIDPRLSFVISHRNYQRNYQNLMSNAVGENATTSNEKGTYLGVSIQASSKISVSGYVDRFKFPWMRYQSNAPSVGHEYVAQIKYKPSKKTTAYFRFRQRNKEKNTSNSTDQIKTLIPQLQNIYRFHISYSILPSIQLKNRVELIDYKLGNNKTEKGYLIYQDIRFKKLGTPFSLSMRYALFQTESYNTRLYAYENDVYSSYSIPAYYNRGSRFYILLNYNITRKIKAGFRYSQTYYDNQPVISPGALSEINGNTKSEIKALLRFKF